MIEIKVLDLLNAEQILTKIKGDAEKNGLNFNLSYKLKKLLDKLSPEYSDIYEQRARIFNKFGEKQENEDGQEEIRVPSEKVPEFNKYWEELLATKVEVFNVFKLKLDELSLTEKYTLEEVAFLEPFLEDTNWEPEPERSKINIKFDDEAEKTDVNDEVNEDQQSADQEN